MPKDNYAIQARQAMDHFLTYDQQALIQKLGLEHDDDYLYPRMLGQTFRIHRRLGDIQCRREAGWQDATPMEAMTLLDLVCDSREDRRLSGKWKNMASFGLQFHQNLLEDARDPWAEAIQADPEGFSRACRALGGRQLPNADLAWAVELFDGLEIAMLFWFADEDFPASVRFLWDENALQYLRYETMYFAKGCLLRRLQERMG